MKYLGPGCSNCGGPRSYLNQSRCRRCIVEANRQRREWKKRIVNSFKIQEGCTDCGYSHHPAALDFDHVHGNKVSGISAMVSNNALMTRIVEEMDKCEVVCANCHRIRTQERV